jgi:lysophospholipase L1-like esterase
VIVIGGAAVLAVDLALDPLGVGDPGFGENQTLLAVGAAVAVVLGWVLRARWSVGPLIALTASTVVALGTAEIGLRVLDRVRPPALVEDARLGWRPSPGYRYRGPRLDGAGRSYDVNCSTDDRGFRFVTDDGTGSHPRVLVTGDSYTHALEVSDDAVWPARLVRGVEWSVWAYAASGWGTLQEAMAVEELVAELRPDVIIWQMCDNDLFNATPELERAVPVYNIGRRRPYLTAEDDIVYVVPTAWPRMRHFVDRHWRLGSLVIARWRERRLPSLPVAADVADVDREGRVNPLFADAARRTEAAVARVRRVVGSTPVVAFSSDDRAVTNEVFRTAADKSGMIWVDGVAARVQALGPGGRALDGWHWSPAGHAAVADALLPTIESVVAGERPREENAP